MSDTENENSQATPIGELFTRVYLTPSTPRQDSEAFRNRLAGYISGKSNSRIDIIKRYMKTEGGIDIYKYGNSQSDFFRNANIEIILDVITLIWRVLKSLYEDGRSSWNSSNDWHSFVSRALREENMAYVLDEECGVHFFVDEEFERNRISALACLEAPRYGSVRTAFEDAHGYLDARPPDTKASVRSAFEALEILARLMDTTSRNLNRWMVENRLKPLALAHSSDDTERRVIGHVFDGLADVVDGLHNYRHGQPSEQPVAPSISLAVFVTSMVAASLRWLVEIDAKRA